MNINNLVIDRVLRGTMFHTSTRDVIWSVTQISKFTISTKADKKTASDANDTPIMSMYKAKECSVDAENALFDFGLYTAQNGGTVNKSTATNRYNAPVFDQIKLTSATSATLLYTPVTPSGEDYAVPYVYKLNGDDTLGAKLTAGSAAAAGVFTQSGKTLTFAPGDLAVGDTIIVFYDHEVNGTPGTQAVKLTSNAKDFPISGKFVAEVLCYDPCDKSTKIFAYAIFPSAALDPSVDLDFTTDAKQGFKLDCQQDYCDHEKQLFMLIVPDAAA